MKRGQILGARELICYNNITLIINKEKMIINIEKLEAIDFKRETNAKENKSPIEYNCYFFLTNRVIYISIEDINKNPITFLGNLSMANEWGILFDNEAEKFRNRYNIK